MEREEENLGAATVMLLALQEIFSELERPEYEGNENRMMDQGCENSDSVQCLTVYDEISESFVSIWHQSQNGLPMHLWIRILPGI